MLFVLGFEICALIIKAIVWAIIGMVHLTILAVNGIISLVCAIRDKNMERKSNGAY